MINCPKCMSLMTTLSINGKLLGKVNGVEVERCEGCGGLWFDRGEALLLKGVSGLVAQRLDTGDPRLGATMNRATDVACPRCARIMTHVDYPGQNNIYFDQCSFLMQASSKTP